MSRIAAIVLAAGSSSRFGPDNKLLESVDGKPLVAHAVDAMRGAAADPIVVVTGHEAGAVQRALAEREVWFVHNPEHEHGMGSSISVGARALGERSELDGVLISLGDMPGIAAQQVRSLVDAFDPRRTGAICVPVFEDQRGHPVLFGADHLAALRALAGDRGARAILDANPSAVQEIAVHSAGVLQDIDTPADLRAAQKERGRA